jgi:hypothetical protein
VTNSHPFTYLFFTHSITRLLFVGSSTQININRIASDKSDDGKQESEITVQNSNDPPLGGGGKFAIARKKLAVALIVTACTLVASLSLMYIILLFNEGDCMSMPVCECAH